MAVERSQHQQWADEQIATLIDLGINPIDAQKSVQWVLDNLPYDADPATYIFPADMLWQEPSALVDDSAAAWMSSDSVPNRFKRLLQAREEDK